MVSSAKSLGVAVIGLGVGRAHVSSFRGSPGVEVRVICDIDGERSRAAHSLVPDATISESWYDAVMSPSVDIVVVATPDYLHAEIIECALGAGKHVFAEKPICITSSELGRISKALSMKPECKFSANMVLRANPILIDLYRSIRSSELGVISHFEASYLYGRFHKVTAGWRGQPPRYSAMLGGGIHMIDLCLWLSGERPTSVYGVGNSAASESLGSPIDDFELAVLRFSRDFTVVVSATMASSVPHSHVLSVHGTKKTFVLGPLGCGYLSSDGQTSPDLIEVPQKYERDSIATTFVDEVLGRGQSLVSTSDVLDCTAVALAIRESISEKREITVRYP